jgi:drug/metabolite transporter (DMT)-like permease
VLSSAFAGNHMVVRASGQQLARFPTLQIVLMSVSNPTVGLLAAVTAALLWAISGVCGKILMTGALSPARLVFYRCALGALILFAVLSLRYPKLLRLKQRDLPFFIAMGVLGLALTQFTYYSAIQALNVGLAILLQYLAPLWIVIFERLYLRLPLTRIKILALSLALLGCSLISGETLGDLRLGTQGVFVGLMAGVCFAAYSLMTQHAARSYREGTILFYSLLLAALFWATAGPDSWQPLSQIETFKYWIIAYVAVFGTIVPYLLFISAMKYLTASQVGIISTLEPVVAAGIAWIFLGERLSALQMTGGLCVLTAILLLRVLSTSETEQTPGPRTMENRSRDFAN